MRDLTLNKNKCEYRKKKLEFFGYVFSDEGMSPDPNKIKDILQLNAPTSTSEVRSLLGMTNYCSRFIKDYATTTEPLRKLTYKNQQWEWTARHQHALAQLKTALASAPVTAYFDPEKETEISVDASPVGLGAILAQVDQATGEKHVVAYASRSLSDTEQRYSQTEREALAVVWACEHFHLYVYGKPVEVYTEHKALVAIYDNPKSKPPARIEQWALRLQPYQLTVRYRKGEENPADYMSRHPPKQAAQPASRQEKVAEEYISYIATTSTPKALKPDEIAAATARDSTLQAVIIAVHTGKWFAAANHPNIDSAAFKALEQVKGELTICTSTQVILRVKNSDSSRAAKTCGGPGPRGTPGHYEDKGTLEGEGMVPWYQPPDREPSQNLSSMPGSHNKHQTRTAPDVPSTRQSVAGSQHRLCGTVHG